MTQGDRGDIDSLWKHLGLDKRDTSYILISFFPPGPLGAGQRGAWLEKREPEA
jgi:hypothetical protein